MAAPRWFRVVFGADGEIVEVSPRETTEGAGDRFVYVLALDAEGARLAATRARARYMQQRRRAAYKAQGLCPYCGRERDTCSPRCAVCRDRHHEDRRRCEARRAGRPVEPSPKGERQEERRASRIASERLAVLLEVQQAWLHSANDRAFTGWLRSAIERAGGTWPAPPRAR